MRCLASRQYRTIGTTEKRETETFASASGKHAGYMVVPAGIEPKTRKKSRAVNPVKSIFFRGKATHAVKRAFPELSRQNPR
jgi:hypothetical protein